MIFTGPPIWISSCPPDHISSALFAGSTFISLVIGHVFKDSEDGSFSNCISSLDLSSKMCAAYHDLMSVLVCNDKYTGISNTSNGASPIKSKALITPYSPRLSFPFFSSPELYSVLFCMILLHLTCPILYYSDNSQKSILNTPGHVSVTTGVTSHPSSAHNPAVTKPCMWNESRILKLPSEVPPSLLLTAFLTSFLAPFSFLTAYEPYYPVSFSPKQTKLDCIVGLWHLLLPLLKAFLQTKLHFSSP